MDIDGVVKLLIGESGMTSDFVLSEFRGWVSPKGVKYRSKWSREHDQHAEQLLAEHYPAWQWESDKASMINGLPNARAALEYKGWVRIAGPGMYSVHRLDKRAKRILRALIAELNPHTEVMIDVDYGDGDNVYGTTAEEVLELLQ